MRYKFTYDEAACVRDYLIQNLKTVKPTAESLLASAVAVEYAVKLSRRLVVRFANRKQFTIPPKEALAIWIITKGQSISQFNEFEMAVVLPIIQDINRNLLNAKS